MNKDFGQLIVMSDQARQTIGLEPDEIMPIMEMLIDKLGRHFSSNVSKVTITIKI